MDANAVAVANSLGVCIKSDAIGLGLFDRICKKRISAIPDRDGVDLRSVNNGRVVRLGKARTVMHQDHFVTGDINELIVFRLQRADIEKSVLREFVQRDQPLSVSVLSLSHGRMVVTGLVMNVDLLDDRVDLLALERALRQIDVPLADLAVDK